MNLFNPNPSQKVYFLPFQSLEEAYSAFIKFCKENQSAIENSVQHSTDFQNDSFGIGNLSIEQFAETLAGITRQRGGEARFNFLSILFRGYDKAYDEINLALDDFIEEDLNGGE